MVKPVSPPVPKNANQRIAELEAAVKSAFENLQRFSEAHNRLNASVNQLGAIVTSLVNLGPGAAEVDADIAARALERAKGEAAAAKAAVTQGIADGKIERIPAVTDKCLVAGHEEIRQEDGTFAPQAVDYAVVPFEKIDAPLQPKFLGQAQGARIEVNETTVFVIDDVLVVNETPPPPAPVAEATPAT